MVPAVPALPLCLVLSPEIPQPENCRKQLLLALESPAVPLQNALTLQFLLRHLGKVSQQAESNSLHPRALGEIFGPLLLRLPGARYVRLLVPAVFLALATVPARTRSPAWNSRAAQSPCWAARGIKLLAAHTGGTQLGQSPCCPASLGSGCWDEPADCRGRGSSAIFYPTTAVLNFPLHSLQPRAEP